MNLWLKDVAPSTELRKWFGHDPDKWRQFQVRYRKELREKKDTITLLKQKVKEHAVTLVYGARDEAHNEALVLKKLLEGTRRGHQDIDHFGSQYAPRNPGCKIRADGTRTSSQRRFTLAIPHAQPGDVMDVRPLGSALAQARTTTLVKTNALEIIRLVIPAGKDIPVHQAHGEITVQCLEGRVAFTIGDTTRDLAGGQLLYLSSGETHALHGIEDSSVLLTIWFR